MLLLLMMLAMVLRVTMDGQRVNFHFQQLQQILLILFLRLFPGWITIPTLTGYLYSLLLLL